MNMWNFIRELPWTWKPRMGRMGSDSVSPRSRRCCRLGVSATPGGGGGGGGCSDGELRVLAMRGRRAARLGEETPCSSVAHDWCRLRDGGLDWSDKN